MNSKKIFKHSTILFSAFLLLVSCKKEPKDYTDVNVYFDNGVDFKDEYLYLHNTTNFKVIDSTKLDNGKYTFQLKNTAPENVYIISKKDLTRNPPYATFFSGDKDMDITIFKGNTKDMYGRETFKKEIKGKSKEQINFEQYLSQRKPLDTKKDEFNLKWREFVRSGKHKDPAARKPMDSISQKISKDIRNFETTYIAENQNLVSLFLLNTDFRNKYSRKSLEEILSKYPEAFQNNPQYINVQEKIKRLKQTEIGALAPDFTMPDVNGKPISLSSFKGKYVLLDFWASWCAPCRKENPHLVKAYNEFKDKGLEVLGVSYDFPGDKEKWLKAIKEDNLEWTHVSNLLGWSDPTVELYQITGIPAPYLIDPEGKIVAKHEDLRGANLEKTLSDIFNK